MSFHQNLEDVTEDQLSLASIHYMRFHYQEAIDIYKRLLLQNRCVICSAHFTRYRDSTVLLSCLNLSLVASYLL